MAEERWITHFTSSGSKRKDQDVKAYLFCFGHAGGSPADFHSWDEESGKGILICPVCLPGHGERRQTDPPSDWQHARVEALAKRIAPALERYAGSKPCALFGHSYGALLAFETAKLMRISKPVYLIVSGRNAPHIPDPKPGESRISEIPNDNEFVKAVAQRYNDTSLMDVSAKHPEMLSFFLPQLRADMESFESYKCADPRVGTPAISCPICVCAGAADPRVSDEGLSAWKDHTKSKTPVKVVRFPGDHFYTKTEQRKPLIAEIEKLVTEALPKKEPQVDLYAGFGTGYSDYNPYEDPSFGFC